MKLTVCDAKGKKVDELTLIPGIFEGQVNEAAIYQVVTAEMNARRRGTASTKTRSEVSGGGTKPWRQKGTGRARAGSIRSPLWVGGGTTFGPKPKEYGNSVPKKVKKLALRSALSARAKNAEIIVIDAFDLEKPETKKASQILKAIGATNSATVVLTKEEGAVAKSVRNISKVEACLVTSLGAYNVL